MDTKLVIDTLLAQEEMTRYRLAKRLGVHESLLSRSYNGESDPGFNEVSRWLSELGYSLTIAADVPAPLEDGSVSNINRFGRELGKIEQESYDYLQVHRMLKQVLEGVSSSESPLQVYYYPESIQNEKWRSFYAATIAYLYKKAGKRIPRFAGVSSNRLNTAWCPIQNLGKAHTEFNETYLNYNILLPNGELAWI